MMPAWLPPLFPVSTWREDTFDALYALFRTYFIDSQPVYRGGTVWVFPEKEDGKEIIFWHLTSSKDCQSGERLPDLRRSERLPWTRPMLEQPDQPEILDWDYEEGDGTIKTYIWLRDHDFVIILKKYRDGRRRLITSYWIDQEHTRRGFAKKYAGRIR